MHLKIAMNIIQRVLNFCKLVRGGCLDEHHGVRVKQTLSRVPVNLHNVIPKSDPPLGSLAPSRDLCRDKVRKVSDVPM